MEGAYLVINNNKVKDVSSTFLKMSKYEKEELIGKNLNDIWNMMRIYPGLNEKALELEGEYFLFTKNYDVKVVNISMKQGISHNELILVCTEIYNSQLEEKFPFAEQIYSDNNIGVAIYSLPDVILLKSNQKYLDYFDEPYNRKENTIGRRINEFLTGWEESEAEKLLKRVISTGKSYRIDEYMYDKFKRGVTYWNITLTPIKENGELKYFIKATTDVTERVLYRKRIEEQAKIITEQKEQLEAIIKNMSDGLIIIDSSSKYKLLNDAAKNYFYQPEFIIKHGDSHRHTTYYDSDGIEIPINKMPGTRILMGERIKNFRMTAKRPDKTIHVSISGSPVFDRDGNVSMAVLCSRDITDQINYEHILKKQRDHFYKIIDTLELPILRISYPDFVMIELNKKAKQLIDEIESSFFFNFSVTEEGNSIKNIRGYFKNDKNYKCILDMERTKSTVYLDNYEIIRKGMKSYVKIIFQPVLNTQGDITEILMIIIDVTHEIEQKEALEKVLKIQGEFFSFIAHEFKTPISITNAAVQAMEFLCRHELSERAKGYLSKIRQSSLQQLRLVNNLLDIIRADAGYLKVHKRNADIVEMTRVITESVSIYAKEKGVAINFSSQIPDRVIAIDDEKYERILLNLLSNAIKFTPPEKNIFVSIFLKKNRVCIEVKDEGVGIPKDKQAIIFERFGQVNNSLTRQSEGTGIGLCLVKFLVNALNGEISLISRVGKGSRFIIFFPDEKVPEDSKDDAISQIADNRLMQIINIEFSNIYIE